MEPIDESQDEVIPDLPASHSDTLGEIIQYALEQEEEERLFYLDLAIGIQEERTRRLVLALAEREAEHGNALRTLLANPRLNTSKAVGPAVVPELRTGSRRRRIPPGRLNEQDALLLAAQREQASRNLYQDLARYASDPQARRVFYHLASQEARHQEELEETFRILAAEEDAGF